MLKFVAVAVTAVLLGAVGATPAVASDGVTIQSCHIVCDGWNPNTAGYEDANGVFRSCSASARTIERKDFGFGNYMELRYSSGCRAAWGRGSSGVGFMIQGWDAAGRNMRVYYTKPDVGTLTYGLVDDAGLTARVCTYDWLVCTRLY